MDLDRLAAVIRPRSYSEAVDLGFRMLRAWWRPLLLAWALVGLPLLAIIAASLHRWPFVALLLVWWIKPLFSPVVVFVLSRGLFGTVPGWGETLRAWPREARSGWLSALTWRRLDPVRSLRAPARQLEGLRGKAARRRFRIVSQDVKFEAALLTLTCGAFECCIFTGTVLLLLTLFPMPDLLEFLSGEGTRVPLGQQWVLVGAYLLAFAVIEPFYIAGGFGLYINRRTLLEAWDIEVVFRRMASRLRGAGAPTAVALALLPLLWVGGGPALFGGTAAAVDAAADPERIIQEVLADPIFGTETTRTRWVRSTEERTPAEPVPFRLGLLGALLAAVLRAVAWLVAAAALAWGIYQLLRRGRLPRTRPGRDPDPPPPAELLGLDLREAHLPQDLAQRAGELWQAGRPREALQLLYRGALSRLISRDGVPLPDSATEGDCVRLAAQILPRARLDYFRALTEAWLLGAYGHRYPPSEQGAALIHGWQAHFGSAP